MRTTLTIDDRLYETAALAAGERNVSALVTKALELLVATDSKKRLMNLAGKAPDFTIPKRDSRTSSLRIAEDSYDS